MNVKEISGSFIIVFVLVLLGLSQSCVAQNQNQFHVLEADILNVSYSINDYQTDSFDCSNMAAQMTDELDLLGYNAEMVLVESKVSGTGNWHVFVVVDRQVIIEPTFKCITFSEGEYGMFGNIDWYIQTWKVLAVFTSSEEAINTRVSGVRGGYSEYYYI